jgi:PAS domain S-box-containing protein
MAVMNKAALFPGNSEMARRMREFDWSKTPLGPIDSWPQNLVSSIRLMLNSRYPMFVWWGRDLINFYNDAYIPVLGARHPQALGQAAGRVWAEIWNILGPQTESVMRDGQATWNESVLLVMERYGYTEETYFTFSYSPVIDDKGDVGGVFCACTEDTKRVIGERRLRLLRALAEHATQAKTAEEACAVAAATMRNHLYDLTFAMVYLLDSDGANARLAGSTIAETPVAPPVIKLSRETEGVWPFRELIKSGRNQIEISLDARFGRDVRLPGGAWSEPAREAVVLRIASPGQEQPSGFLVAGVSPRLLLDDEYRFFLELTAGQVASAIGNARAYEEERKRVEALAQIDRAKTAFFSNVSHEFRTPLTLILGPAEELLSGTLGDTNEMQRVHLTTLRGNALRLQKLVNTLLDFARVEAGRMEASYEPVDIGLLTRDLASTFCSAIHRAGLLYVMNCPSTSEPVYVDREMWEKIVLNLLSNALKFTLQGIIEVSVREVARDASSALNTHIALTVRDTGVGIPEQELPNLFTRFHRVSRSRARTQEGSGIGLALVQELIKLHGGSIEVESAPEQGTTFTVFIPKGTAHLPGDRVRAPRTLSSTALGAAPFVEEALRWLHEESSEMPLATDGPLSAPRSPLATGSRILLADDNADMRQYLKRLLETQWNVTVVEDGAKALEVARVQKPDLVLTDVMMPALNGFELLRELRADERTSTIPVILLSARAGEEAKIEGLSAGADDYLVKPFTARELLARVEAHLKIHIVRREAEKAARESEERFRRMADSSPVIIWTTDTVGHTAFLNRTYREYFGIAADEAPVFDWSAIIHPHDRKGYVAAFQTALQQQQTFHQRVRLRRHDGQWRWFESRGNPLLDGGGNLTGFIGSSLDITEIYESQERLRELDQRKDEFLANMSHEIRSPLTGIMGYADILLTKLKDPEHLQYLKTIKESGNYLIEIVNDILDLSKIEAGKLVLSIEPVSPHEVLGEIQGLMDVRAREKGLPLLLRYEGVVPPRIETDRTRLRQIVINLVSNAIKFTERGRVEIVVRFNRDEDLLQIEVIDTGIGIAPEHQAVLFQPFTQADSTSTRRYGGTGLGLTITKRLVEMLGGSISFESEPEKGSSFRVTIPSGSAQAPVQRTGAALGVEGSAAESALGGYRILIVDDRKEFCYLVSRYIEDAGGRTMSVSDGQSAIAAVESAGSDPFHAVIMDIQMPGLDGYETTRQLRTKGFKTPIIALTAGAMVGDREKCLRAGCDDYLTKPIDRQALVNRIAHHAQQGLNGRFKVLVVDDSHSACELIRRFMEKRGYEIRSAYDGQSALRLAEQFRPDVVVLDIRLPDMNGYELMRRLKETKGFQSAKFIGISGYGDDDADRHDGRKFDCFLEKPLNMEQLSAALEYPQTPWLVERS